MIFFFFQAEDGIRDIGVTGVQTCALPILSVRPGTPTVWKKVGPSAGTRRVAEAPVTPSTLEISRIKVSWTLRTSGFLRRSEERRVGKECRSRWSPYH